MSREGAGARECDDSSLDFSLTGFMIEGNVDGLGSELVVERALAGRERRERKVGPQVKGLSNSSVLWDDGDTINS